ncbi:MAG: heme o synthase [Rhodobacteraceae bacterium]|nr:heme o synthase [Paracoccaceae bacterium]
MKSALTVGANADLGVLDLLAMFKPRVMSLVVFTAMVGMIAAPVQVHPVVGLAALAFIALGAGASGILNMWWDADIDSKMRRTRNRPIPCGKISAADAKLMGLWLTGLSIVMLALAANPLAALLLAITIFHYVVIYTIWLKRRSPQNIVIGGAAGALPPVIGWVVATGQLAVEPLLMFALIFLWTPPHFWALSLYMNDDYERAGIPMLNVVRGDASARWHILGYACALVPVSLLLALGEAGGPLTLGAAVVMNSAFVYGAVKLCRNGKSAVRTRYREERRFFRLSLTYLFVTFAAMAVDSMLRPFLSGVMPL